MKRQTAIRHVHTIAERLRSVGGVIDTPTAQFPRVVVRDAWVFGSVVKGSESPNDVDILLDYDVDGHARKVCEEGVLFDKDTLRRRNILAPLDSEEVALRWLKNGMRMISLHIYRIDHRVATPRVSLFPAMAFDAGVTYRDTSGGESDSCRSRIDPNDPGISPARPQATRPAVTR